MPIYTLTIQITADIEANDAESAQEAAINHFVEQFEESEVIDVDKVTVTDVREAYFEEYEGD